ncbi:MAG: TIGR04013 family B12-binding domain/radical SAM domain-containing protein [Chloroflexota bacterium]|nr:TIGR04013 family B12-binding domain/radical SAM domain-containing protein [Chloroflexota bacterium]
MSKALAFILTPYNKNSIASLTGALETDPRTETLPLHFVRARGDWVHCVARLARNHERLVVALSFATPNAPTVAHDLTRLRALDLPGVIVIAGGPHPSGDPQDTLDMGVAALVVGEGENTLPALVERLLIEESVAGVPGVVTRDAGGQIVHGPRPPRVHLDEYPPCGLRHRRFGPIEISRGCPWACGFCQTPFLFGGRMRHRSVEAIAAWLDLACAAGYRYARFVTPDAFAYGSEDGKTPNLEAIERLLWEAGRRVGRDQVYFASFPSEVRPENVTPETVALVTKYAANDNLVFGAQTGSPRLLRSLRRGHTVEDVRRATEVTVQAGLTPYVDFIFGLPGETAEDRELTLHMIADLTAMGGVIHSHTFMPLPGTPLSHAQPGRVDPQWHALLDRLASQGQHIGQWRKQERLATLAST